MARTIYTVVVGTPEGPQYRLGTKNEDGTIEYVNGHIYRNIREADEAADRMRERAQDIREQKEQEASPIDDMLEEMMLDDLMHGKPILPPVAPPHVKPINWSLLDM